MGAFAIHRYRGDAGDYAAAVPHDFSVAALVAAGACRRTYQSGLALCAAPLRRL